MKTIKKILAWFGWVIGGIASLILYLYFTKRTKEPQIEEMKEKLDTLKDDVNKKLEEIKEQTDERKKEVDSMDTPSLISRFLDNRRKLRNNRD